MEIDSSMLQLLCLMTVLNIERKLRITLKKTYQR